MLNEILLLDQYGEFQVIEHIGKKYILGGIKRFAVRDAKRNQIGIYRTEVEATKAAKELDGEK